ncbi:hypothetical protein [Rheinheimera sp.]|uniref:hypothetical protein n=1 Tax=Rheinheimera sp. TaxID=1869214 RepID=UPI003D2DC40E
MSVRKIIIQAIKTNGLTSFTLEELKVLCHDSVAAASPDQYSQKLYKNVWNLKQKGFLDMEKQQDSKDNRYLITPQLLVEMSIESPVTTSNHKSSFPEFLDTLRKRLNEYSTDLATTSAEAQEYQDLAKYFPEQRTNLDVKYNKAYERAVELRGKLRAIENELQDHTV